MEKRKRPITWPFMIYKVYFTIQSLNQCTIRRIDFVASRNLSSKRRVGLYNLTFDFLPRKDLI